MNSLSQLNTASAVLVSYTDLRASKVTFDRLTPTNQSSSFTKGGTSTVVAGINITSIVNPSIESVYFQVDVSATTGATVTWATLPSGYTVTNIGTGVYRISNIQTAADWTVIKNAVIHSPTNYNQTFAYTCYIGYESTKTVSWTTTVQITQRASLTSHFTEYANGGYLFGITGIATESSRFTVSALGGYLKQTTASLIARFSIIKPTPFGFIARQGNASLSSYSSLTAISWNKILHFSIPRTYQSNTSTFVFTTGNESPVIDDPELSATYTITLVTTNGGFNCSLTGDSTYTTSSTWTYTGTGTYINQSVLSSIKYLPTVDTSNTKTVNYTIQKVSGGSNTWTKSGSFSINWTSLGTFGSVYVFTSYGYSYDQTWSPNLEEYLYGKMDLLIIGAGGAGAWGEFTYGGAGSGGGAGQVLYPTNIAITNQSYTANVGTGGFANGGTPFTYQVQPSGTSTTFSTYTAIGGGGGAGPAGRGGNSGNGFSGGNGYTSGANGGGGGGGGALGGGQNGINSGSGGAGGSGYTSSISGSSIIYAVGGGGGATTGGTGTGTNAGHSSTPGSGGGGGSCQGVGLSNGMPGIVIIKTHN
jgi:hypothetical protein